MLINKESLPLVEVEFMNKTHLEDIDLINRVYKNIENYEKDSSEQNFENLKTAYTIWVNHTVEHFGVEENKMIKTAFFAYSCHKSEHERNLEEIRAVWKKFEKTKDINILKSYIGEDLPNWLINHIVTMDRVTAKFFKDKEEFID